MAMAVMFNAVLFQSHIASHHETVLSPTQMLRHGRVNQHQVLVQWAYILDINYWPIYAVSERLLGDCISDEAAAESLLGVCWVFCTKRRLGSLGDRRLVVWSVACSGN